MSTRYRRIVIILMIINFFALFSNIFNLNTYVTTSYNRENGFIVENRYYLFTDSGYYENRRRKTKEIHQANFWPFVNFSKKKGNRIKIRFAGIFTKYDYNEFFFYTFLIFGIIIIKRIW